MFYVYILQSFKDKRTYVGYTPNIKKRLEKHNSGQVISTKYRRPLKLIFLENFETSPEAKKRELYWKSGAGRRKLKLMFDYIEAARSKKIATRLALLGGPLKSQKMP